MAKPQERKAHKKLIKLRRRKSKLFLLYWVLSFWGLIKPLTATSQEAISEKVQSLLVSGEQLEMEFNWIGALWQYKQGMQTAQEIGDWMGEARALGKITDLEIRHGYYEDTLVAYLRKYMKLAELMGNFGILGHASELWANYSWEKKYYQSSGGYYKQAYTFYSKDDIYYEDQIRAARKLIRILSVREKQQEALMWYHRLLNKAKKTGEMNDVAALSGEIARYFIQLGRLDTAESLLNMAKQYIPHIPQNADPAELAVRDTYLEEYHMGRKELEVAYQNWQSNRWTTLIWSLIAVLFVVLFIWNSYRHYQSLHKN